MSVGSEPTTTRTVRDAVTQWFDEALTYDNYEHMTSDEFSINLVAALGIDGSVSVEHLQRALARDAAIDGERLLDINDAPVLCATNGVFARGMMTGHNLLLRRLLREVGCG